jgi:hypothetical protein
LFGVDGEITIHDLVLNREVSLSPWVLALYADSGAMHCSMSELLGTTVLTVKDLGFHSSASLEAIYDKALASGLQFLSPNLALLVSLNSNLGPPGTWLRMATPLGALVDVDGVEHIVKCGAALGTRRIDTYYGYRHSIFHAHNEFCFCR